MPRILKFQSKNCLNGSRTFCILKKTYSDIG